MEYPQEVQEKIDILNGYAMNNKLNTCHLVHLYPQGLAYPNGYYDSQFFKLVMFNTDKMEKCEVPGRDGLSLESLENLVRFVRIFADGSTLISFNREVEVYRTTQDVLVKSSNNAFAAERSPQRDVK